MTKTENKPKPPEDPLVPPLEIAGLKGWKKQIGNPTLLIDPDFGGNDFTSDLRASFHAHGKEVCASGCAASNHPTPELSLEEFRKLIADYARQPMNESSKALESLLFYGRQTLGYLDHFGAKPLNQERETLLRNELKRTHAYISFRIVDENGIVRTHMPPTRVPLDRRHEFEMETNNLPALQTSGTVKRVGLHHLWTRI